VKGRRTTMNDHREKLEQMMRRLETERDELKMKLGLAKLEARDEWQELEKKMDSLRGRVKVVGGEAKEASGDVGAALDTLGDEIREGFARIRKLI
jgi:SMC interacting uncharacterized protein involved in chromosome segregation